VIGEAVNGPNGYFGRSLIGFYDCLYGGFGVERPFTVRWENCGISRQALDHGEMVKIAQEYLGKKYYFEEGDEDHLYAVNRLEQAKQQKGPTAFDTLVENIQSVPGIHLKLIE